MTQNYLTISICIAGRGICHCGIYYGHGRVIQACYSRGVAVRGTWDIGQSVKTVTVRYNRTANVKIEAPEQNQ